MTTDKTLREPLSDVKYVVSLDESSTRIFASVDADDDSWGVAIGQPAAAEHVADKLNSIVRHTRSQIAEDLEKAADEIALNAVSHQQDGELILAQADDATAAELRHQAQLLKGQNDETA